MQNAREMKLRPAQASAGLRDATAFASLPGGVGAAGAADFAPAGGRFGGPGRGAGEGSGSGFAAIGITCVAAAATGAGAGVA